MYLALAHIPHYWDVPILLHVLCFKPKVRSRKGIWVLSLLRLRGEASVLVLLLMLGDFCVFAHTQALLLAILRFRGCVMDLTRTSRHPGNRRA